MSGLVRFLRKKKMNPNDCYTVQSADPVSLSVMDVIIGKKIINWESNYELF